MAPLKGARRSLAPKQVQQIFELGKQGRKTGITLPDTGERDEHGMEPIDHLFSSPEKNRANNDDDEDEESSEDDDVDVPMDLTTASGPFPLNGQARFPIPRSKSPRKTNFKSPATRAIFGRGNNSSSPTNSGALAASATRPVKRKLNFDDMESQTKTKAAVASSSQQTSRGAKPGPGRPRARPQEVESEEDEEEQEEQQEEEEEQEDQSEEPDVGLVDGGDDSMQVVDTEGGNDYSIESEAEEEDIPRAAPKGKRRRSGRQSLNDDDATEPADEAPKAKRTKTGPQPKGRKPGPAQKQKAPAVPKKVAAAKASKEESAPKKRGRKPKVAAEEVGETSELNIKRGPALPKVNRGLLISRNETLADATHTRYGRASVKPLAFWKNEYIEYARDVEEDDFVSGESRFVVPVMKSIHRVDEPEAPSRKKSYQRSGRPGKKAKVMEEEDEDLEPWEEDPGQLFGEVRVWQPEYETQPPLPEDPIDYAEVQVALAGNAITTKPVANATFRFAKTLNLPFFGSGIVDLPPGAEKTQKNARKMQMVFVVLSGRVTVSVGETEFRIGKGGMWFVPRGNYYGMRNDGDNDARVFFAQGCEVPVDLSNSQ